VEVVSQDESRQALATARVEKAIRERIAVLKGVAKVIR
jgi:hypothetical protein